MTHIPLRNLLPYEKLAARLVFALCFIFALARCWIGRLSLGADGISYIDLSDSVLRHDWRGLLNAYWSPLYPLLLGIFRLVLPDTKPWQLFAVHLLNVAIFALALFCFEFFYAGLRKSRSSDAAPSADTSVLIQEPALWILAHMLFLWVSLDLISLWDVGADLLVSAFVYLVAGLILRFSSDSTWRLSGVLGLVLGASYFAKAPMFPLAFVFIGIGMIAGVSSTKAALKRGVISGISFLIIAGPLVAMLSLQKHRLTFGDSGRINYAMLVSPGGMTRNWQGEPAWGIRAVHPTRKLLDGPALYEFATPIGGTFPPWSDPSYWQEGRVARFRLAPQFRMIATSLLLYSGMLLQRENELLAAVVALLLFLGKPGLRAIQSNWPLILMCAAAFTLYMFVHAETRFLGGYVAVLWLALLSPLLVPGIVRRFSACLLWAVAGCLLLSVAGNTVRAARDGGPYSAARDIAISDRLDSLGLRPGDRIGIIGDGGIFPARFSHVKIVAEIMPQNAPEFWRMPVEKHDMVFGKFVDAGAQMILATDPGPSVTVDASWFRINGEPLLVHKLNPAGAP
ncbi:MAG TPA: hypothetical protein VMG31_15240 [Verrucomicrobiae bacterium]|nr:hypothetical protein [Verrucomicrobiae bacterium]